MYLSIIIPVYNCEKYVSKAIDSVLNQKIKDYEIIIVNDGSTDKSKDICESYANKYENITLINQENQGVSVARNKGIEVSKGKYIMFLDADDEYVKDFVNEQLIDDLSYDFDIIHYSSYYANKKRNRFAIEEAYRDGVGNECLYAPGGHFCSCAYSKELLINNNILFDEGIRVNEDLVFKFKAFYCAKKIKFSSRFNYMYCYNDSSTSKHSLGRFDFVDAWKKCYEWLLNTKPSNKLPYALNYVQVKINSRALLYAKNYVQLGNNETQLINELKNRNIYNLISSLNINQVLPYLKEDLHFFKTNLNKFVSKSKKEGNKIKYGRLLLKIPFVRYLRDKRKYNIDRI